MICRAHKRYIIPAVHASLCVRTRADDYDTNLGVVSGEDNCDAKFLDPVLSGANGLSEKYFSTENSGGLCTHARWRLIVIRRNRLDVAKILPGAEVSDSNSSLSLFLSLSLSLSLSFGRSSFSLIFSRGQLLLSCFVEPRED